MRSRVPFVLAVAWLIGGCSLLQSFEGLSGATVDGGGPTSDGGNDGGIADDGGPVDDGGTVDGEAEPRVPIVFVQANAGDVSASGVSTKVAFKSATARGDAIVLVTHTQSSVVFTSVLDSQGNTFANVYGPHDDLNNERTQIFLAEDIAGGPDTITVTGDRTTSFLEVHILEYSGFATPGALDQASGTNGSATGIDGMKSPAITTTVPNALIFGVGYTGTAVAGTGFAIRSNFKNNVVEDRIVSSPGPYQATATLTSGNSWAMLVAAFKGR